MLRIVSLAERTRGADRRPAWRGRAALGCPGQPADGSRVQPGRRPAGVGAGRAGVAPGGQAALAAVPAAGPVAGGAARRGVAGRRSPARPTIGLRVLDRRGVRHGAPPLRRGGGHQRRLGRAGRSGAGGPGRPPRPGGGEPDGAGPGAGSSSWPCRGPRRRPGPSCCVGPGRGRVLHRAARDRASGGRGGRLAAVDPRLRGGVGGRHGAGVGPPGGTGQMVTADVRAALAGLPGGRPPAAAGAAAGPGDRARAGGRGVGLRLAGVGAGRGGIPP